MTIFAIVVTLAMLAAFIIIVILAALAIRAALSAEDGEIQDEPTLINHDPDK